MQRITVVSPDRKGLIAEMTELLSSHGVNLGAVDARILGMDAVLHLSVDEEANQAITVLTQAGYQAITQDVVAIRVTDEPGALARVARKLTDAHLDIRGVSMLSRGGGHCIVAVDTDDNAKAREVMSEFAI